MKEYTLHLNDGNTIKTKINNNEYFLDGTYKKAKVLESNGAKDLYSYETRVARITRNGDFIRLWDGYSLTTMKHINQFCRMFGLKGYSATEWRKLPVNKSNKKKWIFEIIVFNENGKTKKTYQYEEKQRLSAVNKASNYLSSIIMRYRYIDEWTKRCINEKESDIMQLEGAQIIYKEV